MVSKDEKPPTSKEEAYAKRKRPPPEKYDPDNTSHWSITKTLAWIIRRDLDAVRNQCDSYREKCADWRYMPDATARAKVAGVAMMNISTGKKIAPFDPDLQKKLQKKLPKKLQKDLQKGSWHLCSWKPSGWNTLPASEHIRPRVAIDELWQAAGEGRIKATAIEYKNAKAIVGDLVEIPAHYWPRLKRADDPSGKAMLSDDQGRVYREVKFPRLDAKKLWPESPPLSGEVEKPEQTGPAEPELLEPKASPSPPPTAASRPQWERAERYIGKHFPRGVDDNITTAAVYEKLDNDPNLEAELGGRATPSTTLINRVLGRRKK